jgi:opacity protein-like surface antigen
MKRLLFAAALLFSIMTARSLSAEAPLLQGFYAGLAFPYHSIGGDFDGSKILIDAASGETYFVPKIDPAVAYGVLAGYRGRITESQKNAVDGALEVTYASGKHGASFNGASADVNFAELYFDLKAFFKAETRLQPYGGVGLSFSWLTAKNLVSNLITTGDALYQGIGFNLEAGAGYFVSKNVMVDLGMIYRIGGFTTAKGVDNEVKGVDPALEPKMFYPVLKLEYMF